MSGRFEIRVSSLRRQRTLARLPRVMLLGVLALLALVGVHTSLTGHPGAAVPAPARPQGDLAARAFAEAFTRAYLSWNDERPQDRERALRGYTSEALDPGGGMSPPERDSREVTWTTVTQDMPAGSGRRVVTVAAEAAGVIHYLAVPVGRDERGFLYLAGYPALVGGPATTTHAEPAEEPEVEDARLRAVVSRALSNYLAREARNLRADLDPSAVVSLPPQPLRMRSLDSLTRTLPGWVAAQVAATNAEGAELTLRYELRVVRRDRWYVRSIGPNPTGRSAP